MTQAMQAQNLLCLSCRWFNLHDKKHPCHHPQYGDVISLFFDGIDHTKCVYYEPKAEVMG